jgi:hypothetical protein
MMRKLTLCIYLLLSVTSPLSSALAAPLHDAAFMGDVNEVKRLIAEGAKVNEKDSEGRTPLHWAALNNRTAVAELLIVNGARVNAKDEQRRTPLQRAASNGHENMVQLLKRHGAKDNVAKRRAKWQVIMEDEAKLVFYWPGSDEPRVIRKRRKASANTVFTEMGHWQARGSDWPRAVLFLQELATDLQYTDNRTLTEVTKKSLPNATIIATGDREESYNPIGRVELQRFTRDSSIECVALRQYTGYTAKTFLQDQGLGDTLIYGWYCTARHAALTDADVKDFVQGIGVKGIALPERPAPLVRERVEEQLVTCVLNEKRLPDTKRGRGLTRPETTLTTTRAACLEEGGTISE